MPAFCAPVGEAQGAQALVAELLQVVQRHVREPPPRRAQPLINDRVGTLATVKVSEGRAGLLMVVFTSSGQDLAQLLFRSVMCLPSVLHSGSGSHGEKTSRESGAATSDSSTVCGAEQRGRFRLDVAHTLH